MDLLERIDFTQCRAAARMNTGKTLWRPNMFPVRHFWLGWVRVGAGLAGLDVEGA
jgi:hypothetical protein